MLNILARMSSYFFHPLFLYFYMLLAVYLLDPISFNMSKEKETGVIGIMTFMLLVVFPLVSVLLMRKLSFIRSFEMEDKKERIGPLIATSIFYIWYFVNVKNNVAFPPIYISFCLGGAIAISLAFFINNFTRISLHTVGAGAFVIAMSLFVLVQQVPMVDLRFPLLGAFRVSTIFVLFFALFIAGWIGTARLILKVHQPNDVYGGYVVGILSQVIAFRIIM